MTSSNSPGNNSNSRELSPFDTPPGGISLKGLSLLGDDIPESSITVIIDEYLEETRQRAGNPESANAITAVSNDNTPVNLSDSDLEPTALKPASHLASQSRVSLPVGALVIVKETELVATSVESAAKTVLAYSEMGTGKYSVGVGPTKKFSPSSLTSLEVVRMADFVKVGSSVFVRVGNPDVVQFTVAEVKGVIGENIGVSVNDEDIFHIPGKDIASMNSLKSIDIKYVNSLIPFGTEVSLRLINGTVLNNLTVNQILPTGVWLVDNNGFGYLVLSHQLEAFLSLNLPIIDVNQTQSDTINLSHSGAVAYSLSDKNIGFDRIVAGSECVRTYMATCEDNTQVFNTFLGFLNTQVAKTTPHSDLVDLIANAALHFPEIDEIEYCSVHLGENRLGEKGASILVKGNYKVLVMDTRRQSIVKPRFKNYRSDSSVSGQIEIGLVSLTSDNLVCNFSPSISEYISNKVLIAISNLADGDEDFMRKLLNVYFEERLRADGKPDTSFSFILRRP